jgi:hypothetical protein
MVRTSMSMAFSCRQAGTTTPGSARLLADQWEGTSGVSPLSTHVALRLSEVGIGLGDDAVEVGGLGSGQAADVVVDEPRASQIILHGKVKLANSGIRSLELRRCAIDDTIQRRMLRMQIREMFVNPRPGDEFRLRRNTKHQEIQS